MVFSEILLGVELFVQRAQRKWANQGNHVLSRGEIEQLLDEPNLSDPTSTLNILESALISHREINGISYHTKFPQKHVFEPVSTDFYNKAIIADGLARFTSTMDSTHQRTIYDLLENLSSSRQPRCVQLFAWNTLGMFARKDQELRYQRISQAEERIASSNRIESLTSLAFFKQIHTVETQKAQQAFLQGITSAKYEETKAAYVREAVIKEIPEANYFVENTGSNALKAFSSALRNGFHPNTQDFFSGLEVIGLDVIKSMTKKPELWANTAHAYVIERVKEAHGQMIGATGAFIKKSYQATDPKKHQWISLGSAYKPQNTHSRSIF